MSIRPQYILAIDQGTTATKALLLDSNLQVAGQASAEFRQLYPRPGWVEHDPEDIWASLLHAVEGALNSAKADSRAVAGIGLANQGETVVAWDRETGDAFGNAIVWQCRRSQEICERLSRIDGLEAEITQRTGLLLDPYFSATKFRWILENEPGAAEAAARGVLCFGTVDTWLVWRLTGGASFVTEPSTASRTMLFDIHDLAWSDFLLGQLGIPTGCLPDVIPSDKVAGANQSELLDGREAPIVGLLCDQQAALLGQGCRRPGQAKCTFGTGAFLLLNTGQHPAVSTNGLLTSIAWQMGDRVDYFLDGGIYTCGRAVDWLRDGLGIVDDSAETEALARSVQDTAGVTFIPAFNGLAAPYWKSDARGLMLGITHATTRAHVSRATLEAIAYRVRDVAEALEADFGAPIERLSVDGGLVANGFLMVFLAGMLGIPVDVPEVPESTALGVGYLCGRSLGIYDNDLLERTRRIQRTYEPDMDEAAREALYARWKRTIDWLLTLKA